MISNIEDLPADSLLPYSSIICPVKQTPLSDLICFDFRLRLHRPSFRILSWLDAPLTSLRITLLYA